MAALAQACIRLSEPGEVVSVQSHFDGFDEAISLGDAQVERMERAWETLRALLTSGLGVSPKGVFLQGSYANGTAVVPPAGGEYDVDVVCAWSDESDSPEQALDGLAEALKGNGNYATRVTTPRKSCVRLEYAEDAAGRFHVDVCP